MRTVEDHRNNLVEKVLTASGQSGEAPGPGAGSGAQAIGRRSLGQPGEGQYMPAAFHGPGPVISVVVPAHNCAAQLRACLESLRATTYPEYEVIVVDDASTDETCIVAAEFGVRSVRQERQNGPAQARNEGARVARGEFLLFLDADVCVHPETLGRVVGTFVQNPAADAVFGSYDNRPPALNLLSQYKNLCHHFVHQEGVEQASTFWTGCGAIKRSVFLKLGGFDHSYRRPCIEDIELGMRLRKAGYRIVLNKHILVTHLKRWTLWGMVKTDVWDRAVPWTQLLVREGAVPNDLNLKVSQRVCAVLAFLLLGTFVLGAWFWPALGLLPVLGGYGLYLLDNWSATRRVPTVWRVLGFSAALLSAGAIAVHFGLWSLVPLLLLLGIIVLNYRLYAFFAREKHWLFAALAVPLQVLYFLYSGMGLAVGVGSYWWSNGLRPALAANLPLWGRRLVGAREDDAWGRSPPEGAWEGSLSASGPGALSRLGTRPGAGRQSQQPSASRPGA
jgi:glycosyltransferase involved in cell wall biosynthesis